MKTRNLCFMAIILCFACRRPDEYVVPEFVQATSLQAILDRNAPAKQVFNISNEIGGTITGARGTRIEIAPYTYGSFSGPVLLSLQEVYTKSEMAATGIFTSAYGSQMLESQGMFEVKATRNGKELTPEKESIVSMNILPGTTPENTRVFKLKRKPEYNIDTVLEKSSDQWVETGMTWEYDPGITLRCIFRFPLITWCNLDAYIEKGANNRINIIPPSGISPNLMTVYFSLDGVNGLMNLNHNSGDNTYRTYPIRPGYSGRVIIVNMMSNRYYTRVINIKFTNSEQVLKVNGLEDTPFSQLENILKSF
jgi:hypothetical protein